ncbi:hypothetical protein ACJBPT_11325, partial [Streptococcus suis]
MVATNHKLKIADVLLSSDQRFSNKKPLNTTSELPGSKVELKKALKNMSNSGFCSAQSGNQFSNHSAIMMKL